MARWWQKDHVEDPEMVCDSSLQCVGTQASGPSRITLIVLLAYVSSSLSSRYKVCNWKALPVSTLKIIKVIKVKKWSKVLGYVLWSVVNENELFINVYGTFWMLLHDHQKHAGSSMAITSLFSNTVFWV